MWRSSVTGFMYMRNRWYSPRLAQFISHDPLGYVDSYNPYQFALFDPINYWDPWGLSNEGLAKKTYKRARKAALEAAPRPLECVMRHCSPLEVGDKKTEEAIREAIVDEDAEVLEGVVEGVIQEAANSGPFQCGHDKECNEVFADPGDENPVKSGGHNLGRDVGAAPLTGVGKAIGKTPKINLIRKRKKIPSTTKTLPKVLPKNPEDLLKKGYRETTHPKAAEHGHRTFVNPNTGDKLRFDKGTPGNSGHSGRDHYHRYNPNSSGKRDEYLDIKGDPAPRLSVQSHLYPEDL